VAWESGKVFFVLFFENRAREAAAEPTIKRISEIKTEDYVFTLKKLKVFLLRFFSKRKINTSEPIGEQNKKDPIIAYYEDRILFYSRPIEETFPGIL
jgi:hypothetical protein